MKAGLVKGAAHITGGGLPGNVVRILPSHLDAVIDSAGWNVQPVFGFLSSVVSVFQIIGSDSQDMTQRKYN